MKIFFGILHTPEQTSCSQRKKPIVAVNASSYSSPFSAPVVQRSSFVSISTFSKLSPSFQHLSDQAAVAVPQQKNQENAPKRKVIVETATVRFEKRPFGMAPSKEAHGCFCTRDDHGKKTKVTSRLHRK